MRHRKRSQTLSRPTAHRRALLMNLVRSLFLHERISTTVSKAKAASSVADRMITLAKKKDVASQRRAFSFFSDRTIVRRLFKDIGPRYQDRKGGYTRVVKLGRRFGDRAFMAILELVDFVPKEPASSDNKSEKKELAEAKVS